MPAAARQELALYLTGKSASTQYLASAAGVTAAGAAGASGSAAARAAAMADGADEPDTAPSTLGQGPALPRAEVVIAGGGPDGSSSSTSASSSSSSSAATAGALAATYGPGRLHSVAEVLASEVALSTRASVLRAPGRTFPQHAALVQAVEDLEAKRPAAGPAGGVAGAAAASAGGSSSSSAAAAAAAGKKRGVGDVSGAAPAPDGKAARLDPLATVPIIIVPSAASALINIRNIEAFLGKASFVAPSPDLPGQAPPPHLLVLRRPAHDNPKREAVYHIIDNPDQLSPEAWKRVVGVFVTGQNWQISRFPIGKSAPAEIFAAVRGFHAHYEGEEAAPNVRAWNVRLVPVSRSKRHQDTEVVASLWRDLTAFISGRPALRGLVC